MSDTHHFPDPSGDNDFPTSSLRSMHPSSSSSSSPSSSSAPFDPLALLASTASAAPRMDPSFDKYTPHPHRELAQGILPDGRITVNHPLVRLYLSSVRCVANDRDVTPGDDPFGWKPREKEDRDVHEVLGFDQPFTQREGDCIFVLAALKVYYNATHKAHFTFWSKAAAGATAEKVQKILDLTPCPIASPIGWMHKEQNLWLLEVVQATAFPASQRKRANGMTLRDRRSAANENASPPTAAPSRPKRVRPSPNKPASSGATLTPLRQSARLATAQEARNSPALGVDDLEDPAAAQDSTPTKEAAPTAVTERIPSPVVPELSALPALGGLSTPSVQSSSLTPSPASQASAILAVLPTQDDPAMNASVAVPARRSARVPKKRQIFSPNTPEVAEESLLDTPDSSAPALPAEEAQGVGEKTGSRQNALGLRARSSSSAQSYESGSTAVSSEGSTAETAVDMEVDTVNTSSPKKRKHVIEDDDDEYKAEDEEKERRVDDVVEPEDEDEQVIPTPASGKGRRASARPRKSTPKAKAGTRQPVAKKARTAKTKV